MNKNLQYYFLFIFMGYLSQCGAIDRPVYIQRACLDRVTGVLTVYFKPQTPDGCGSFNSYKLYGRDNTANPFTLLASSTALAATQLQAPLPNKKQWEVYITTQYSCNGTDTLNSDTILIDDTPPAYLEPDSVSVDLTTQKLIAGWTVSPEPDVMGYSLFKSDPATGNNVLIDKTFGLSYSFNTSTFDPTISGNRYRMAAYDSCDNGGPISSFHSPVLLQKAVDPSGKNYQCTRQLFISWLAYVGWPVSTYDIYVKDNISNTWILIATVPPNQLNYTFTFPGLGPTYSFYIRARKSSSPISSSSNIVSFATTDFIKSSVLQINHVSVINDGTIDITGSWGISGDLKEVILQSKSYGSSTWGKLATFPSAIAKFQYSDNNKLTSQQKYSYRLIATNTCNEIYDSSIAHTSILLRRMGITASWNAYWGWASMNNTQYLEQRDKQSFTWNNTGGFTDSAYIIADTTLPFCYRVATYKFGINGKPTDTAYSNQICLTPFDSTLIPTAFTPGGINPVFNIINKNLTPGQAKMTIYDRWGGKIFEGDALIGWDGKDNNGVYLGPGIYPYTIQIVRIEKRELYKGTVTLIR